MNSPRQPLTMPQAMNRAAAMCARSEQSPADIRAKLVKWGLTTGEVDKVLLQLHEQDFLNEDRFARAFVKDKFAFNGWGRIKIAHQLRQKGISPETIDQAMTALDEERYRSRLMELLQAKWRTVKEREPRQAWAAMMRFAASRGFEANLSSQCITAITSIDVEDD